MLALNRSLLNREYILINVLKALASIVSVFIFEDYIIYKWNISSKQCKMRHRRTTTARKVNPLSHIFINCNTPAPTPGLH
jgi:hypothetical protein